MPARRFEPDAQTSVIFNMPRGERPDKRRARRDLRC